MLTYFKLRLARILLCLSLATLSMGHAPLVCLSVAALSVGCASPSPHAALEARFPDARIHPVCVKPKLVGWDANEWVYTPGGTPVSSTDEIFPMVAARADVVFTFDATAPEGSTRLLTIPDNEINCAAWLHAQIEHWCPLKTASDETRANPRWLADPEPNVRSPWLQGVPTAAFAPNCATLVREAEKADARKIALDIGSRVALVLEGADGGIRRLHKMHGDNLRKAFERKPEELDNWQTYVANKLNAIPDPPLYDDPELAGIAQKGFEDGYGVGANEVKLKFAIFDSQMLAVEVAIIGLPGLARGVGLKALQLALTRFRRMPMFIPGSAGGAGFFLRLPKTLPRPAVANANAPSVLPGALLPRAPTLAPFGNLSRAAEFGIKTYDKLIKAIKGTNLQGHHLLEQRFVPFIKNDARMNLTVAVTDAEHQLFTNKWRSEIAYGEKGTHLITPEKMNAAARRVYKDHPAILQALGL